MRRLIYYSMVSLDGYIARPDGDLDWVVIDEELHKFVNDQQRDIGTYVYGRAMYDLMSAFWPTADADPSAADFIVDFARIWRGTPKVVFSNTLDRVDWNSRLVRGDPGQEIAKLKSEPGKDLSLGGSRLAGTVIRSGLVDAYYLFVNPVVLGSGIPLFPSLSQAIGLKLVETHKFASGVVFLQYDRVRED